MLTIERAHIWGTRSIAFHKTSTRTQPNISLVPWEQGRARDIRGAAGSLCRLGTLLYMLLPWPGDWKCALPGYCRPILCSPSFTNRQTVRYNYRKLCNVVQHAIGRLFLSIVCQSGTKLEKHYVWCFGKWAICQWILLSGLLESNNEVFAEIQGSSTNLALKMLAEEDIKLSFIIWLTSESSLWEVLL